MDDGVRSDPGEGERFDDGVRVALIKAALLHLTVLEFTVEGEGYDGPDPHTPPVHALEWERFAESALAG